MSTICGVDIDAFSERPTPSEIAAMFADLAHTDMADFFDGVAKIAEGWESQGVLQWDCLGQALRDRPGLKIIAAILEHSHRDSEYTQITNKLLDARYTVQMRLGSKDAECQLYYYASFIGQGRGPTALEALKIASQGLTCLI